MPESCLNPPGKNRVSWKEKRAAVPRTMSRAGSRRGEPQTLHSLQLLLWLGKHTSQMGTTAAPACFSPGRLLTVSSADFFSLSYLFLKISGIEMVYNGADGEAAHLALTPTCSATFPNGFQIYSDSTTPREFPCRISIKY